MASTHGTLSTSLTGNNNDIDWTARIPTPLSSSLKLAYVNPGTETAIESVSVSTDASTGITTITVTLRSVSSTLSTAAQVLAAVAANPDANALISGANKAANDGTGNVIALAATAFSAGAPDATTKGYATQDEMEDAGWVQITASAPYVAERLLDGFAVRQGSNTANGILEAAFLADQQWLAKKVAATSLQGVAAD